MRGAPRAHDTDRTFRALSPENTPAKSQESLPSLHLRSPTVAAAGESAQTSRSPTEFSARLRGQRRSSPGVLPGRRSGVPGRPGSSGGGCAGARRLPGSYNSAAAPGRAARLRSGGERGGKEEMSGRRIGGREGEEGAVAEGPGRARDRAQLPRRGSGRAGGRSAELHSL